MTKAQELFDKTAAQSSALTSEESVSVPRSGVSIQPTPIDNPPRPPKFANDSEREFAAILDFYQLAWQYEPRTFPLVWDENGKALESFAPDFYLTELDLYIELTVLRQRLVTKKNRKLRRLRELYPDVNIRLFYGRDFRSLMTKYGLNHAGRLSGENSE